MCRRATVLSASILFALTVRPLDCQSPRLVYDWQIKRITQVPEPIPGKNLEVSLTHTNNEEGLVTHAGTGTGTIDVQEGDLFNVYYTPKASTTDWTMSLLER